MAILIAVLLLHIFLYLVSSVGAQSINELLWTIYSALPISSNRQQSAASTAQRNEAMRLKRQLDATSPQDEFAKWAKLRRQYDKAKAEHDKSSTSLQSTRAKFDATANVARQILTTALRYLPQYYYAREPMFWLPAGWVPGYVEWVLSLWTAPRGSVSIYVWTIACSAVVNKVGEGVGAAWVFVRNGRMEKARERGKGVEGMKMGGEKEL